MVGTETAFLSMFEAFGKGSGMASLLHIQTYKFLILHGNMDGEAPSRVVGRLC